jgi:hypothetical protein
MRWREPVVIVLAGHGAFAEALINPPLASIENALHAFAAIGSEENPPAKRG